MIIYACLMGAIGALIAGTFVRATPFYWSSSPKQILQVIAFALMIALAAGVCRVEVGP